MVLDKVSSVAGAGAGPSLGGAGARFRAALGGEGRLPASSPAAHPAPAAHAPHPVHAAHRAQAAGLVNRVTAAQARLDTVLRLAESGRTFTPAELLAFQAHVFR